MADPTSAVAAQRHLATTLKILVGAFLLWFLHHQGLLDPRRILQALRDSPGWIVLAAAIHGALFSLLGLRWRLVARSGGIPLDHADSQRLSFISHFFSTCLPGNGAGDLVKAALFARRGIPFAEVLGTMAVDRVAGMSGLFLTWTTSMAVVAWLQPTVRPVLLAVLPLAGIASALLVASLFATAPLGRLFHRLARKLPRTGRIGRAADHAAAMFDRMNHCASRPSTLLGALAISLVIQGFFLAAALCAARTLGISLGLLEAGAVLPLASLANALPLSPGGVGVGESAASLAMSQLGHPASAGSELMLVLRLVIVLWAVVGGVLYASTTFSRRVGQPA